jgi:hypothetical protein
MSVRDDVIRRLDPSMEGGYQSSGGLRVIDGMTDYDLNAE